MGLGDFPVGCHALQIVTKHCKMQRYPIYFIKIVRMLYQNLIKVAEKEKHRPV